MGKRILFSIFILVSLISLNLASGTQTYLNESTFWEENLTKIIYSSLALGDIDNDGDIDLIANGQPGTGKYSSEV